MYLKKFHEKYIRSKCWNICYSECKIYIVCFVFYYSLCAKFTLGKTDIYIYIYGCLPTVFPKHAMKELLANSRWTGQNDIQLQSLFIFNSYNYFGIYNEKKSLKIFLYIIFMYFNAFFPLLKLPFLHISENTLGFYL